MYVPRNLGNILGQHLFLGQALIPRASYKSKRVSITINEKGFRGKNFQSKKPPGVFRIFCLGGSSTFGMPHGISSDENTYPYQLEKILNREKPNPNIKQYEVINAGVIGYSTRISTINFLGRIIHYDPDMIIVYHNTNDLSRYGNDREIENPFMSYFYKEKNLIQTFFETVVGWSYVYQEIKYRLTGFFESPSKEYLGTLLWKLDKRFPETFKNDLTNLATLAISNNVIPLFATQSIAIKKNTNFSQLTKDERDIFLERTIWFHKNISKEKLFFMFSLYNNIIKEVAIEKNVLFSDVNSRIPKTPKYHRDFVHLTDAGASLVAQSLYSTIKTFIQNKDFSQ
jgi:lysophospholipase L1-like esterase